MRRPSSRQRHTLPRRLDEAGPSPSQCQAASSPSAPLPLVNPLQPDLYEALLLTQHIAQPRDDRAQDHRHRPHRPRPRHLRHRRSRHLRRLPPVLAQRQPEPHRLHGRRRPVPLHRPPPLLRQRAALPAQGPLPPAPEPAPDGPAAQPRHAAPPEPEGMDPVQGRRVH